MNEIEELGEFEVFSLQFGLFLHEFGKIFLRKKSSPDLM